MMNQGKPACQTRDGQEMDPEAGRALLGLLTGRGGSGHDSRRGGEKGRVYDREKYDYQAEKRARRD